MRNFLWDVWDDYRGHLGIVVLAMLLLFILWAAVKGSEVEAQAEAALLAECYADPKQTHYSCDHDAVMRQEARELNSNVAVGIGIGAAAAASRTR